VIVEFIEYRRQVGEDGKPIRSWVAEWAPVSQGRVAVRSTERPQRFGLMVVGEAGAEDVHAAELFERVLGRALGHEAVAAHPGDAPTPKDRP
jgi:hypothetical protein